MMCKMKIILSRLDDGTTELQHNHTANSLGIVDKNDFSINFTQQIEIYVRIDKYSTQYILNIQFKTIASLTCDCCLCEFNKELTDNIKLVYAMGQLASDDDAQNGYRIITTETKEIDITDDIKDSLLLLIPMKIICTERCKGLCQNCGIDLNHQICNCSGEQIDPRWEVLKNLKKNNFIKNN